MKTLHLSIILASTFLLLTFGTYNIFASQEFTLSSLPVNPSSNPPVIIDQVELDSAFAFFPDNQTCYDKPGFLANYTCSTSLVPDHKVQCEYFIGGSYCEPIHQYTSGTRQACLNLNLVPNAPQWFDMYNTQNKTVQIRLFGLTIHQGTGPWGQEGVFPTIIDLGPYEKCTYAFGPVDEPLSLDQTNMSTVASYTYGTKNYTISTPELTDIQNDSRTWQLDGNKWVFAEQNTVQAPEIPILPLQQFKSGISTQDVTCKEDLQLVIKSEDGSPACVKPDTAQKLIERGWAKQAFYYHDTHMEPKITLNDYSYAGIDEEGNTTVSIDNQTYYQTTLNYSAYHLPDAIPIQFHNITFTFPAGTMITPGGAFVMLDVKFPDGFEETYGTHTANEMGGIPVPTQYGPHLAVNSTMVLSNHLEPQAGMTIYHDKIRLLVSTDVNSTNTQTQTSDSSSALKLYFSTSSQVIPPGQTIGITISVNNTLSNQVMVQDENSWKLNNLNVNPCTTAPYGIAIFDGFYTEQNMTQGRALSIFNPYALCPVYNQTQTYVLLPSSGIGNQFSFSGTWENGQIQPFKSGLYTIVGGDEWGHVAIEHFVVSNSTIFAGDLGRTNCPMMYGGVQFGTTIKNSTGFTNYYNSTQYGNTFFLHPGMQGTINVQYSSPANASWFQNNGNAPLNMTNSATLSYMVNVTEGKSVISYAVQLYNDETGHHSRICHYGIQFGGGFEEPCNTDNTGDIPLSELSYASKLLHVGINTSFEPNSVMFYPDSNPISTTTVSVNSDVMPGVYWLSIARFPCGPGILAKLVVLP